MLLISCRTQQTLSRYPLQIYLNKLFAQIASSDGEHFSMEDYTYFGERKFIFILKLKELYGSFHIKEYIKYILQKILTQLRLV